MNNNRTRYLLVGLIGAFLGAIAALAFTKAVPKMMSEMMPMMMENLKACMEEGNCDPKEI